MPSYNLQSSHESLPPHDISIVSIKFGTKNNMFFLPLFDRLVSTRTPYVSWGILGACVIVFLWQLSLDSYSLRLVTLKYGVIPSVLFGHQSLPAELQSIHPYFSIITSMFLHGGWLHIASNMLYLWIFGDNIEASMGHFKFILFYIICGAAAAFAQSIIAPYSITPMIGASGGIAGILGAYIVLHPKAPIQVLMIILIFIRFIILPAWVVLGVWIGTQFAAAPVAFSDEGGVAYFAHIGGFIAGACLIPFFKRRELPLFGKYDPSMHQSDITTPITFREVKEQVRHKYAHRTLIKGEKNGSLPSFRKRRKGPWDI